jgi:hypothetical protein
MKILNIKISENLGDWAFEINIQTGSIRAAWIYVNFCKQKIIFPEWHFWWIWWILNRIQIGDLMAGLNDAKTYQDIINENVVLNKVVLLYSYFCTTHFPSI